MARELNASAHAEIVRNWDTYSGRERKKALVDLVRLCPDLTARPLEHGRLKIQEINGLRLTDTCWEVNISGDVVDTEIDEVVVNLLDTPCHEWPLYMQAKARRK